MVLKARRGNKSYGPTRKRGLAPGRREDVELTATIEAETKDALLAVLIDGTRHWLPKTQVKNGHGIPRQPEPQKIFVTAWIAEQKGIR